MSNGFRMVCLSLIMMIAGHTVHAQTGTFPTRPVRLIVLDSCPGGTPRDVINRLHNEVARIAAASDYRTRLE